MRKGWFGAGGGGRGGEERENEVVSGGGKALVWFILRKFFWGTIHMVYVLRPLLMFVHTSQSLHDYAYFPIRSHPHPSRAPFHPFMVLFSKKYAE